MGSPGMTRTCQYLVARGSHGVTMRYVKCGKAVTHRIDRKVAPTIDHVYCPEHATAMVLLGKAVTKLTKEEKREYAEPVPTPNKRKRRSGCC